MKSLPAGISRSRSRRLIKRVRTQRGRVERDGNQTRRFADLKSMRKNRLHILHCGANRNPLHHNLLLDSTDSRNFEEVRESCESMGCGL